MTEVCRGIRCIAQDRLKDFRSLQGTRASGIERSLEAAAALCQPVTGAGRGKIVRLKVEKNPIGALALPAPRLSNPN